MTEHCCRAMATCMSQSSLFLVYVFLLLLYCFLPFLDGVSELPTEVDMTIAQVDDVTGVSPD